MKKLLLNFILVYNVFVTGCALDKDIKISGNMNYTKQTQTAQETLKHSFEIKYRKILHEPPDKKYLIYLGGNIHMDQDIFNNVSKVNAMSSAGIEF